jgi:hypothetical protein
VIRRSRCFCPSPLESSARGEFFQKSEFRYKDRIQRVTAACSVSPVWITGNGTQNSQKRTRQVASPGPPVYGTPRRVPVAAFIALSGGRGHQETPYSTVHSHQRWNPVGWRTRGREACARPMDERNASRGSEAFWLDLINTKFHCISSPS